MCESLLEPAIKVSSPPGKSLCEVRRKKENHHVVFTAAKGRENSELLAYTEKRDRKNEKHFHERALYDFSSASYYYAIKGL